MIEHFEIGRRDVGLPAERRDRVSRSSEAAESGSVAAIRPAAVALYPHQCARSGPANGSLPRRRWPTWRTGSGSPVAIDPDRSGRGRSTRSSEPPMHCASSSTTTRASSRGSVLHEPPRSTEVVDLADSRARRVVRRPDRAADRRPVCGYDSVLLRHGDDVWTWWLDLHHVVTDGWSVVAGLRATVRLRLLSGDDADAERRRRDPRLVLRPRRRAPTAERPSLGGRRAAVGRPPTTRRSPRTARGALAPPR